METLDERMKALEGAVSELRESKKETERRLNRWRGAAIAMIALSLAAVSLRPGRAVADSSVTATSLARRVRNLERRVSQLLTLTGQQTTQITALQTANTTLTTQIAALQTANTTLTTSVNNLGAIVNPVSGVLGKLSSQNNNQDIFITGANLHVVNGTGDTETANGLGNLIVGYNEAGNNAPDRGGSHNIVLGMGNQYSSFGGLVAGSENGITAPYATVTGGFQNIASNPFATVTGGTQNRALRQYSSVTGGFQNSAGGQNSSVNGGSGNSANGNASTVSGGTGITLTTDGSWAGGAFHTP
jgi:hypothetical protein